MIWPEEKLSVKVGFLYEVRVCNEHLKTQTFSPKMETLQISNKTNTKYNVETWIARQII
jgi:hypothetical protein